MRPDLCSSTISSATSRFELKGDFDLVTEADRASEKLVVERLKRAFPGPRHRGRRRRRARERVGVPLVCGSAGRHHELRARLSGLQRDAGAREGRGTDRGRDLRSEPRRIVHLRKGRRARSSTGAASAFRGRRSWTNALFSTGFPSRRRHLDVNIHFYHQLAMATHGVRRGGAAAIDLAYVACGRLDGFWEFGLSPWDMAAGKLLVAEAGGICTRHERRVRTA